MRAVVRSLIACASASATAARMCRVNRLGVFNVARLELNPLRFHQGRQEGDLAGLPEEFGHEQRGLGEPSVAAGPWRVPADPSACRDSTSV